ncbi:hypothetical protein Tco_1008014 [Tanacetum coccineum]
MNALVDQGSDMNVMPFSIYNKLTDEKTAENDIRLSLASHSYISPLEIAEDVLVDVTGYVIKKGIKNDIEPIAPTMTVNRLVLEWEEKIKLHQDKEIKFDQWRSKIFKNERPASMKEECEVKDEDEVTKAYLLEDKQILKVILPIESRILWITIGIKPGLLNRVDKQQSWVEEQAGFTQSSSDFTNIQRMVCFPRGDTSGVHGAAVVAPAEHADACEREGGDVTEDVGGDEEAAAYRQTTIYSNRLKEGISRRKAPFIGNVGDCMLFYESGDHCGIPGWVAGECKVGRWSRRSRSLGAILCSQEEEYSWLLEERDEKRQDRKPDVLSEGLIEERHGTLPKCSWIFKLELVPSCLINCVLEPLSLDLELLEIIYLASSLEHLCNTLPSCDLVSLDQHAHTLYHLESCLTIFLNNL